MQNQQEWINKNMLPSHFVLDTIKWLLKLTHESQKHQEGNKRNPDENWSFS